MTVSGKSLSLLEILAEKQIITSEQLAEVQRRMTETERPVDQILVEMGALTEDDLAILIGDALQVRYLKLEDVEIDREAVKHVPATIAHRYKLVPVRRSGNALAVTFADPANPDAHAALQSVTDFEIIPFYSKPDAIEHALYLHYGEPTQVNETVHECAQPLARPQSLLEDDRISHMGKSVQINRHWTFDQLVEDAANQFPLSVARSVSELQSDSGYNPFLCWGATGCGKSHLLHAIANHLSVHSPLKRYILTTGQKFADNLFEAIRDQKLNLFRFLYRELDVLMLDDADDLLNRDWAQSELVETFQALRKNNKQLVLASRSNLAIDPGVAPKLRELLETGVIAGFGEYSVEAKVAMASRRKGGIELPSETLLYLVRRCGDSVNDLMNLLQQVTVLALHGEREITREVVDDMIRLCGVAAISEPQDSHGTSSSKSGKRTGAAHKTVSK